MENHHFSWVNPLEMAIFNSHVKLPEGNYSNYIELMGFIMVYKATNINGGHHPVEVLILEPLFWVILHGPLEAVCLLPISGQRLS